MKRVLLLTVFLLATLAWATAQQSGSMPQGANQGSSQSSQPGASSSQSTTPGASQSSPQSTTPGASQSSPATPGAAGQTGTQSSATGTASGTITEGCLGGSASNYTITDKAGKTYKLNIPASTDSSPLASHVGESVKVLGNVNNSGGSSSIDVQQMGRGTGTCPGSTGSAAPQPH